MKKVLAEKEVKAMEQSITTRKKTENSREYPILSVEEVEKIKRSLDKKERELKKGQRQLELDRKKLQIERDFERARLARENQLFSMKWKLLEEEVKKLADEKQQVERQKIFYEQVNEFERRSSSERTVRGDMFFAGVTSELALKKRYKDLIKIYHPDNISGDTNTIQEINREYDQLKERLDG